jgi:hypothetical protein
VTGVSDLHDAPLVETAGFETLTAVTSTPHNIVQQSPLTQGSFSFARDNFLEVVAAPLSLH